MLYDVELDLNESSKGREQTFKQILLQLSIIEGYKGDLWALFCVSICCPAVLKFFFIQMVSIDPTGHILAQYSDFFGSNESFRGLPHHCFCSSYPCDLNITLVAIQQYKWMPFISEFLQGPLNNFKSFIYDLESF